METSQARPSYFATAYLAAAWLFAILIPIQFFLAGTGAFQSTFSTPTYTNHMLLGLGLHGISVLLILFAFFGRLGSRLLGYGVLQFVLISLQIAIVQIWSPGVAIPMEPAFITNLFVTTMQPLHDAFGSSVALIASLHSVNGLAIALVAVLAIRAASRLSQVATLKERLRSR